MIDEAAELLANLRLENRMIDDLPAELTPTDLDTAYAIQGALVERLIAAHGGTVAGYKVACTNAYAQEMLGTDGPVFARLTSATVAESPATIPASDFQVLGIEPEFAFRIARDVPATDIPWTRESIAGYLGDLHPAIELIGHRFGGMDRFNGPKLAADDAMNQGFVHGPGTADWRGLDLAAHEVKLYVDGLLTETGAGDRVMGHPLNSLAWLANALPPRGLGLRAGDWVTTGIATDLHLAGEGETVRADFGALGAAEIRFE